MNVVTKVANPLKQLEALGQSPWLDFIQRSFTADGLQALIDRDGLKGITSNPAIFEKAMGQGTDYDEGFKALAGRGDHDALDIYEALAIEDIQQAADLMRPVYEATNKVDGYISLEVSPYLALRTEDTVAEARRLWATVGRENLMVKVPGTEAGVPAIRTLISEGININVTLLFAQSAYEAVAEAFIAGLEDRVAKGGSIAGLSSVASFFVSRIDSVIDKKIDGRLAAEPGLKALRGKVAIANAKLAYQHYLGLVASPRWAALAAKGALPQRLLWASTGVKDKAYSDVMYVEQLIGRDTVDTIPPATMDAFRDHGTAAETLTKDLDEARHVLAGAEKAGLDLPGVTKALVADGVTLFAEAADKLLGAVAAKRTAMLGDRIAKLSIGVAEPLKAAVQAAREDWRHTGKLRDLWAGDAKVWTGGEEAKWLGWLRVVDAAMTELPRLMAFQDEVKAGGFSHVVLLGMGGSSLGPEVLAETFGKQTWLSGAADPGQHGPGADRGPRGPARHDEDAVHRQQQVRQHAGAEHFQGVLLGPHAEGGRDQGGRAVRGGDGSWLQDAEGGRGGRVPARVHGRPGDRRALLRAVELRAGACGGDGGGPGRVPDRDEPDGARLRGRDAARCEPGGAAWAAAGVGGEGGAGQGDDRGGAGLTDVGAWLEQLLAESTGKQGHGIVPVDGEPLGAPGVYGEDRVFAYMTLAGHGGCGGRRRRSRRWRRPGIRWCGWC